MKRIISGISALIICLNFTISVSLATDGFAGGSGTQSDPYLISTAAQLERVRYDRFAHYKLQNDIVFTSADFAEGGAFFNGGEGFFPLCSGGDTFRGVLDGNGHKIRNLYINRSMSTYAKVGLFGDNRGTIKNLGLENARISVNALGAISTIDVGGIAGWNEGRIENCHITGEITVTSEAWYTGLCVGGMAGENMNGQVIDCDNKARISGESVYSVNVGGLVGLTNGGSVTKCYNQGALSGKSVYYEAAISVGGIAAIGSETTISDCYNIGALSAVCDTTTLAGTNDTTHVGGIIAQNKGGSVNACYNTGEIGAVASTNHSWAGGIAASNTGELRYCYNEAGVSADYCVGGIVGDNGGTLAACYNTATVISKKFAGGIAGSHMYKAADCYNVGAVQGEYVGGIFGERLIGEVWNCYYRDTAEAGTGHGTAEGTMLCTASQLQQKATFVGFDFESEWQFYTDMQPYPVLRVLPVHTYDHPCDKQCNTCALPRNPSHDYGKYSYNGDATDTRDGTQTRICSVCGDRDTVTAAGTRWTNPFTDVKKSDFYYTPVLWAVHKGITAGTGATTFSPKAPCTRSQIVAFLWRAAGSPKANGKMPFADVKKKDYYYDAVLWAVQKGITTGTSDTTFSPAEPCTRGQIVSFLWRAAGSPESVGKMLFTDVKKKDYYYHAVMWAVNRGITSGTSNTTFSPADPCTRGQIAAFLYRNQA